MDPNTLIAALRGTMEPNLREAAERQLSEGHSRVSFASTLLQVTMSEQLDLPVRQAAAIYLKNMVTQYWNLSDSSACPSTAIPQPDRMFLREHIVEAIISSPELIRVQLAMCIHNMMRHDFPGKWPEIVEKIGLYLQSDNAACLPGILLCLYHLVKNYEYKKVEERGPLVGAMQMFLPLLRDRFIQLLPDTCAESTLVQKQILKIYFVLFQYNLPVELVNQQNLAEWIEIVKVVVDREVPQHTLQVDEDERPELPWWKCKKWAVHILARLFGRYGSPGNVSAEYAEFAKMFLKTFAVPIQEVLLKVLYRYKEKQYVAPRVLQQTLNYLNQSIMHSLTWKSVKPHIQGIVQDVLFPLMCYTEEDEQLWKEDPYEYIRMKFDVFEDFVSPVTSAQNLLITSCKKRKEVLQKTIEFCSQILMEVSADPRRRDGSLHMIGSLAEILLKKKLYKDQLELLLQEYVFLLFHSEMGFMRARACWVLHYFSKIKFKSEQNLQAALERTRHCLINDPEMPVRVEAAIALQALISHQDRAKEHITPFIRPMMQALLQIMNVTENDGLTSVIQKMICEYREEVAPIAVELTQQLASAFNQMIHTNPGEEGAYEKAITAMGILSTIDTLLGVMEDHTEITQQLEGICLHVIGNILQQHILEFYEEILSLAHSLTCRQVSPQMWHLLPLVFDVFQQDGFDFFIDMMPLLHNYITVDTDTLLSDSKHLEIIYSMCSKVLSGDCVEEMDCHAAKLLEIIILQCKGRGIDEVVPLFVRTALERLTGKVKSSELSTMCLQVAIAALYYNPILLLNTLENLHNNNQPVTNVFFSEWLRDIDHFVGLHDRKMCVLGLCVLMSLENRPQVVSQMGNQLLPVTIRLFNGLKRAYACRDECKDENEEEKEDGENAELGSDEDDLGEEDFDKRAYGDESWEEDDAEETALESYTTAVDDSSVDEYQIFKVVMQNLQSRDPVWYLTLMQSLNEEQTRQLEEIGMLADKRRAEHESKMVKK